MQSTTDSKLQYQFEVALTQTDNMHELTL